MQLHSTRALLPRVEWRERSPSTNVELRELLVREPDLPHGTLLATSWQTAGRGRLDRGWETPPGVALAVSILLRGIADPGATTPDGAGSGLGSPHVPLGPGWLPLLAGSAVADVLQPLYHADSGKRVGVKWPNDVHVRSEEDAAFGRVGGKLCGILCELIPGGSGSGLGASGSGASGSGASGSGRGVPGLGGSDRLGSGLGGSSAGTPDGWSVIVGMGLNLLIPEEELPTERATSLLASGADVGGAVTLADPAGEMLLDQLLAAIAQRLLEIVDLAAHAPERARVPVLRHSLTLGSEVRVHLPGDRVVDGRARTLAEDGSLVVDLPTGGELTVSAGDVEHLR